MTQRLSPLALCLPFCGILVGYFVAKALADSRTAPIGASFFGFMVLLACSICGLLFAMAEVRDPHRIDGLAAAAILVNGFLWFRAYGCSSPVYSSNDLLHKINAANHGQRSTFRLRRASLALPVIAELPGLTGRGT